MRGLRLNPFVAPYKIRRKGTSSSLSSAHMKVLSKEDKATKVTAICYVAEIVLQR